MHLLSYEVPLGFAAIGPAMAAESLSTVRIVETQAGLWYVVWQPLGLIIYVASALYMTYRWPFDIPQAGSELESGVLAEYTGATLLLFKIALSALFFLLSAMGVVLFFGGWHGPLLPDAMLGPTPVSSQLPSCTARMGDVPGIGSTTVPRTRRYVP